MFLFYFGVHSQNTTSFFEGILNSKILSTVFPALTTFSLGPWLQDLKKNEIWKNNLKHAEEIA